DFLGSFNHINISRQDIIDFPNGSTGFDICLLSNVSEHLLEPVFALHAIARNLKPGGELYLTHHNFYSWNGHHLAPSTPDDFDPANPAHVQLADWAHIDNLDYFRPNKIGLNLIRIHDLMSLLERDFEPVKTEHVRSAQNIVDRLTPVVRNRLA